MLGSDDPYWAARKKLLEGAPRTRRFVKRTFGHIVRGPSHVARIRASRLVFDLVRFGAQTRALRWGLQLLKRPLDDDTLEGLARSAVRSKNHKALKTLFAVLDIPPSWCLWSFQHNAVSLLVALVVLRRLHFLKRTPSAYLLLVLALKSPLSVLNGVVDWCRRHDVPVVFPSGFKPFPVQRSTIWFLQNGSSLSNLFDISTFGFDVVAWSRSRLAAVAWLAVFVHYVDTKSVWMVAPGRCRARAARAAFFNS